MTPILPPVLGALDLPAPELHAARLDGEVFALDECFCPIDEIEQSIHRARALAAILPGQTHRRTEDGGLDFRRARPAAGAPPGVRRHRRADPAPVGADRRARGRARRRRCARVSAGCG